MNFLSKADLDRISAAGKKILRTVGAHIGHGRIVDVLAERGALVDRTAHRVRFPEELIDWAIQTAPSTIHLSGVAGQRTPLGPQGETVFWTGNALYTLEGRSRREITAARFADYSRLCNALENVHGVVTPSIADTPPTTRDFVGFHVLARYTAKHLRPCIFTPRGAEAIWEMAQVLLDGRSLEECPLFSLGYTIVSPLHWSETALELFATTSGKRIPMMINAEPMAGGTAPVTLAGALALACAEAMSGLAIAQTLEPGRPCIFSVGFAHALDMQWATALTGAPENGLMAGAGLSRHLGLPGASWMSSESTLNDSQNALEKMNTGLLHALGGVNVIWGLGNFHGTQILSPIQTVIDNEIAGIILRSQRGIEVNDETLAIPLIQEMDFSSRYIEHPHTLKHYRRAIHIPKHLTRCTWESWERSGAKSLEEKAEDFVADVLRTPAETTLSSHQLAELQRIEDRWRKEILDGAAI